MSESNVTAPQDELLKSRTQLRALEAELNRLKDEQLDQDALNADLTRLQMTNEQLQQTIEKLSAQNQQLQVDLDQSRSDVETLNTQQKQAAQKDDVIAELELAQNQLLERLDEANKSIEEIRSERDELSGALINQEKAQARQFLIDQQFERVNAQMDLIKDVLLRREPF